METITNSFKFQRLGILENHLNNYQVNKEQNFNFLKNAFLSDEYLFLAYAFGNKFREERIYNASLLDAFNDEQYAEFNKDISKFFATLDNEKELKEFLNIMIRICSSSGAFANLYILILYDEQLSCIFIPPSVLIVDQSIGECFIYIKYNEASRVFEFTELRDFDAYLQLLNLSRSIDELNDDFKIHLKYKAKNYKFQNDLMRSDFNSILRLIDYHNPDFSKKKAKMNTSAFESKKSALLIEDSFQDIKNMLKAKKIFNSFLDYGKTDLKLDFLDCSQKRNYEKEM